jgi:hypothetical protein
MPILGTQASQNTKSFLSSPNFVALTNVTSAARSTDGITWTESTLPVGGATSGAYGNSTFVVVRSGTDQSLSSTDGITLSCRSMPAVKNWSKVIYVNNKFVAVANSSATNSVATSTDGITWTQVTTSSSTRWNKIAHGNNTYVIIPDYGTVAASSTDAITWTTRTIPYADYWDVEFGSDKFVAIPFMTADTGSYSTDGITWATMTLPNAQNWFSIAYGNGVWVAAGEGIWSSCVLDKRY